MRVPAQAVVWTACHAPVAHALGAIDGVTYTNSPEAFAANYAKGFRVFEVDLARTRDGPIVAVHDWRASWPAVPRLAEFKARKVAGRYTQATLGDVLEMLRSHSDSYLILDLKDAISDLLPDIVKTATAVDSELVRRIIPQISSMEEVRTARRIYPFPSVILTLYRTQTSDAEVLALVARAGIPVVTMSERRFHEALVRQLDTLGARVYVHTVNDPDSAAYFRSKGVWGIYTDVLGPESVSERCPSDTASSRNHPPR